MKKSGLVAFVAILALAALAVAAAAIALVRRRDTRGEISADGKNVAPRALDCEARQEDCVPLGMPLRFIAPERALALFSRGCERSVARACTEAGLVRRRAKKLEDAFAL